MTSPLELELATIVEAVDDADQVDAAVLARAAHALRGATTEHDYLADYLEGMARRAVVRMAMVDRMRQRGMLEATTRAAITDLAEE